jgi:antibiotic biosynthesis monooxygenase (ABM) superfamily enzyme
MTAPAGPPTQHQLALMIWLAVFPTLTALNLLLGDWLGTLTPVVRTFVLVTVAVPIVTYGLMPQLHRARRHLLAHAAGQARVLTPGASTLHTPDVPPAATSTQHDR